MLRCITKYVCPNTQYNITDLKMVSNKYLRIWKYKIVFRCSFTSYMLSFNKSIVQIPILQFGPIQPAEQLHIPSVWLHVLQFKEQTREQFSP